MLVSAGIVGSGWLGGGLRVVSVRGGVWAGSRVPVLCLKDREGLKGLGVPSRECFGQAVVKGKAQSSSSLSCLMCDLKVWQYGVA